MFLRNRSTRRRWLRFESPESLPERAAAVVKAEITEALARTYAVLDTLPADERGVTILGNDMLPKNGSRA